MNRSICSLSRAIVAELSSDLLSPRYKRMANANKFTGHCYVASEALFHLCGGRSSGLVPQVLHHEGSTHWYLKRKSDARIFDLTWRQFGKVRTPLPKIRELRNELAATVGLEIELKSRPHEIVSSIPPGR